jgi:hypothetical protein
MAGLPRQWLILERLEPHEGETLPYGSSGGLSGRPLQAYRYKNIMKARFTYFTALVLSAVCLHAAVTKPYHETLTPKSLSEWRESRDEKVSVCFAVDKTTFRTNDTITVRCAVRNNGDKPLTILRPFGDPFYAHCAGIAILGPDGAIPYRGAMKEYVLGTSSFLELAAHSVIEEAIDLPTGVFPGLGKAGLYTIGYQFMSGVYPKQPAPDNYWQGQVKAAALTILVR